MVSSEGEKFEFRTAQPTEGAVELWLGLVEAEMIVTLRRIQKEATFHYPKSDRVEWVTTNLGLMVNTGATIWWTYETEDVFERVRQGDKMGMKRYAVKCSQQLDDLIVGVRDTKGNKEATKKINTLIIIDVHARDIVSRFVRDSILDATEFEWESQLRFYWDKGTQGVVTSVRKFCITEYQHTVL